MTATLHQPIAPTRSHLLPSGARVAAHRHDENQIVYPGRGSLEVQTSVGGWVALPDRAIWIPAGVEHEHVANSMVELHLVGIVEGIDTLSVDQPTVLQVRPLLRELIKECSRTQTSSEPGDRRLQAVLRDQLSAAPPVPGHLPAPTTPLLRQVATYFLTNPAEGRTLAEMGRVVGASERTLSRLFKSDVGMSFPQWRLRLRLHHAALLLAEDLPVTVVAHRCGWSSASAFITAFRLAFGYTPGSRVKGADPSDSALAPAMGASDETGERWRQPKSHERRAARTGSGQR
jgi:AraC-like DNA-binding protein